ncbi:MAG TPA: surface-adhesin E family protein [Geothrix sp.]|jgi:hypothetical protein
MFKRLLILVTLSAPMVGAGDLTFLADAINPGNGKKYKAYIDRSTIHRVGAYESVKLVSIYEQPISAAGFAGVKSMVNIFQVDCRRHVKRVTYIGFLDTQGRVIIEEKYPHAPDEPFGTGTVDLKVQPYLCIHLTDPVR